MLFLLYINDLPNCLSDSQPRMYADDTHPAYAYADNDICSIDASLNQDLLIANKTTLNMTKTEFEINSTQLNRVNFTKSLGVLI